MIEYSQYPEAANDSVVPDGDIDFDAYNPGEDDQYQDPPPGADELPDPDEDEEIRELNRRSGKGLYVIVAIIAFLAIAALAVGSTLLVQKNRSIEDAQQTAIPPPPAPPTPSTNTNPPTNPDNAQGNIIPSPTPTTSDGESSPASNLTDADSFLTGTTTNGTTTGTGITVNATTGTGITANGTSEGGDSTPTTSGTSGGGTGGPVDVVDGATGSNGGNNGSELNDGTTGGGSGSTSGSSTAGGESGGVSATEGDASDSSASDGSGTLPGDLLGGDIIDGSPTSSPKGDDSSGNDGDNSGVTDGSGSSVGLPPVGTDSPTPSSVAAVSGAPTTSLGNITATTPPSSSTIASTAPIIECIINGVCSVEGSSCAIGKETCCGETFNSVECDCIGAQWLCRATDACNRPDCEDPITTAPTSTPSSLSSGVIQTEAPTIAIQSPQAKPTPVPSKKPSISPSFTPTPLPTKQPTKQPSRSPTTNPTDSPYSAPTYYPTYQPSANTSTLSPSNKPSRAPSPKLTPLPSKKPSLKPSLRPSTQPTSSPSLLPSSPQPTSTPSARPSSQLSSKPSVTPSYQPTFRPSLQPSNERTYCVNIKFTTDNYPGDNGFTFLSKETGEILYEQKTGSMKEAQTEYFQQFCDLSAGSYELIVTDTGGDGITLRGNGSYVVDIDGQVILVGGRFIQVNEISHEILVGFDAIMSETDQGFLEAHNSRRKKFHESQEVSFRPMAWSAELAAGASAWAKEKAKTCTTDGPVKGKYGQNSASQRLNSPDDARSPDEIVTWWAPTNVDEKSQYNNQFTAVMWRSSLYVGCASEIGQIENSDQYCQVTNCRYVRTGNCAVPKNDWVAYVLDQNGNMCDTVFCPGADENGDIVEGVCHA